MPRLGPALLLLVSFALSCFACGSRAVRDVLVTFDSGAADAIADVAVDTPASTGPLGDGSPYFGKPCVDDKQCDDGVACTYDACDKGQGRCNNIPDDTQCDNGIYCDGKERCLPGHGCGQGPIVACSGINSCNIARCVEATKSCAYTPRDVDGDGDPDGHCPAGHDCNDLDPNVSSLHAEVCANGIDDNCNGVVDEIPCIPPQGDTCGTAVSASGSGTYSLTTAGNNATFFTSCSVSDPSSAETAVIAITVAPGPDMDLDVWATTTDGVEVAIAIDGVCGQASSELSCGSGAGATSVRARARSVRAGTYYAVVTTQSPTSFELRVDLLAATPPPANVGCVTAGALQPGVPMTVSIVDPPRGLPSACSPATGALTYAFATTQAQDVRVYASTVQGSGTPIVGLRDPSCAGPGDELGCRNGSATPLYVRNVPPGRYVVTVAATSAIDVTVDVALSPPSPRPPDQTCTAPPAIAVNAAAPVDLSAHEGAIQDGCMPGSPDAAFDLTIPSDSDVLLVWRIPSHVDKGAVSLDAPACTTSIACAMDTTPVRIGKRNVAAGDYRAVVADALGLQGTLDALVRPTIAPTILPVGAADTCDMAPDASSGGFFTGDTSLAKADYSNPCDDPTSAVGGAPDQVLSLNLAQPQRVVLDAEGSSFTTLLDVRRGPGCPGTPVMGGCYVGFSAQKSFLDLSLQAGQYWIIVDGYAVTSRGAWNLDVRVLPP